MNQGEFEKGGHDKALINHILLIRKAVTLKRCVIYCKRYGSLCRSVNYSKIAAKCELNDKNAVQYSGNLQTRKYYNYYGKI